VPNVKQLINNLTVTGLGNIGTVNNVLNKTGAQVTEKVVEGYRGVV